MKNSGLLSAAVALVFVAALGGGCSSSAAKGEESPAAGESNIVVEEAGTGEDVPESESAETDAATTTAGGEGDYAFGAKREQIATVFERTYSRKNAQVRWEGDTFILTMDGDANGAQAEYDCVAVVAMLLEGDVSIIEYPNGTVECAAILAD